MTRARTDACDETDARSLTGNRCGMRRVVHRWWLSQRLNERESHGWFGVPKNPNSRGVSVLCVEQDVERSRRALSSPLAGIQRSAAWAMLTRQRVSSGVAARVRKPFLVPTVRGSA